LCARTRGDAPHVVRRLPLAIIFRAFGAAALSLPLAIIFRAFGAAALSLPLAIIFRAFGAAALSLPLAIIFRAFGVLAVCVGVGALSLGLLRLLFANNDGEEAQKQGIRVGIQEMTI